MIHLNNDQTLSLAEVQALVTAAFRGRNTIAEPKIKKALTQALEKLATVYRNATGIVLDGFAQPGEES